jgi:hypothetical protein
MIFENALEQITTPEEAFLVGYLAGDATFRYNKKKLASGEIKLHPQIYISDTMDLDILNWIANIFPNTGVKTRERVIKEKNRVMHTLYFPKAFQMSLEKFGLFNHKPTREILGVPDELFLYAFQGLSLADGCVHIRYRKDCKTPRLNFCIAHQSYPLFNYLKEKLNTEFNYPSQIRSRSNENVIYLDCQHTEENKKFLKLLFVDTECPVPHKKVIDTKNYLALYPEGLDKEIKSKFKD